MRNTFFNTVMALGLAFTFNAIASAEVESDVESVRAELVKMIPSAADAEIIETEVANVFRLELGGSFAFAYVDGDHVLIGDLLNTKDMVNMSDKAQNEKMAAVIADVPSDQMISFTPAQTKRYITVFTDIDCGFCRKLHAEVPELNEAGVEVRYLAFPRAGVGSGSYDKYVSVWCNADPQDSMTRAKLGEPVAPATCENPVASSYQLGQQVGVRGTPTIIFDDGTIIGGYKPSAELISILGLDG